MTPDELSALRTRLRALPVSTAIAALEVVFPLMPRDGQISALAAVAPTRPDLPSIKPPRVAAATALVVGYTILHGTAQVALHRNLMRARYAYAACDALLIVMFVWGFAMAVGRLVTAWLVHGTYRRKLEEYEALRTRWGALNAQVRASVPVR